MVSGHQKEGGSNDPGVYDGEVLANKRHGTGTFVWADGGTFTGEWVEDRPQRGVMERCSYFNTAGLYTGEVGVEAALAFELNAASAGRRQSATGPRHL